jgi:hypothetical protein
MMDIKISLTRVELSPNLGETFDTMIKSSSCKFNTEIGIIHQISHVMQFAAGRFFRVL